jgi:hypothetical protein
MARYAAERDRTESGLLSASPKSDEAFAAADVLTRRWLRDVAGAGLPDRRPRWLRARWSSFDRTAGLTGARTA